jgi:hypothetical protein
VVTNLAPQILTVLPTLVIMANALLALVLSLNTVVELCVILMQPVHQELALIQHVGLVTHKFKANTAMETFAQPIVIALHKLV